MFCHIIIWAKTHRITTTRFEASSELRDTHGLEPFQEQLDANGKMMVQKSGGNAPVKISSKFDTKSCTGNKIGLDCLGWCQDHPI